MSPTTEDQRHSYTSSVQELVAADVVAYFVVLVGGFVVENIVDLVVCVAVTAFEVVEAAFVVLEVLRCVVATALL